MQEKEKQEVALIKIITEDQLMDKVNTAGQTIEDAEKPLDMLEAIKVATVLRNAEAKAKADLKEKTKDINDQIKLIGKYAKDLEKDIKAKALATIKYMEVQKENYKTGEIYFAKEPNLGEKVFTHKKKSVSYVVDKWEILRNKHHWLNKVVFERPFEQWVGESLVVGTEYYIDDEKIAEFANEGLPMKAVETAESLGIQWKEIEALIRKDEKDEQE